MVQLSEVAAVVAFGVVPLLLVVLMSLDLGRSYSARSRVRDALAEILRSKEALWSSGNVSLAEFHVGKVADVLDLVSVPRPVRSLTRLLAKATGCALHSEFHEGDLSTNFDYIATATRLLDDAYAALDSADVDELARVTGRMFVLDAKERVLHSDTEVSKPPGSQDHDPAKPLLSLAQPLDRAAQALALQDPTSAKGFIDDAIDYLQVVVESEEVLGTLLLGLQWARSELHSLADVRPCRNRMLYATPENAVVDRLRRAALAARRGEVHHLVDVIARSPDAYRTPRV